MLLHGTRALGILTMLTICLGALPVTFATSGTGSMPQLRALSATPTPQPGARVLAVRSVGGISCDAAAICQVQVSDQLMVSGSADAPEARVVIALMARSAAPSQTTVSPTPTTATPAAALSIVTKADASGTFSATLGLQMVAPGNYQIEVDGQLSPFAMNILATKTQRLPLSTTPTRSSPLGLELAGLAVLAASCALVAFWWDARRAARVSS